MRYAIYKLAFVMVVSMSLFSCGSLDSNNFNMGSYVGVISFNKDRKVSFINQYNENGKHINKVKFSIEGMGYLDDFIPSDDENFYVKSSDILSKNGKNYIIEVDKFNNGYSKINLDIGDIYKIVVDEDYIYITHSINKLSRYDKDKKRIVDTINLNDYVVEKFYVDDSNVYLFTRDGKERSFLNILNKHTFEILRVRDITSFGVYQNDVFFYEGKLYFTNYDTISENNSGKIGIYNTETERFGQINIYSKNLDKVLVYDDEIYVTVKADSENILNDTVVIIDRESLKSRKKILDYNVKVFDIVDDKIFILSDDYLYVYNADDFSLHKEIKLSLDENSVVSGIIVYDF